MKTFLVGFSRFILSLFFLVGIFSPCLAQVFQKVKDVRFANSFPFDFTISNNKLFFIATDNTNSGVFVTDGTDAGTIKLTSSIGFNSISDIVAYNNKIYFSYNDGVNGYELWVSDGTLAGTSIFKDINPGSTGSFPKNFTVANSKLFFITDIDQKLFVCDGTPAGTTVIKNNGVSLFNGLSQFAILNNDIYFTSDNGTGLGYGLWKSDGTLAGTQLVKPELLSPTGGNYAVLGNKLYFSGFDYTNGSELWVSDGTDAGTHMVINLRVDGGGILYSGAPSNMIVFNNKIYFTASDDTHGAELFSSDGTEAGTQIVKDMQPGTEGSVPQQSVIYNGNLFFSCYGGSAATGLWKSDGTTAGTTLIKQGGGGDPFLRDTKFAPLLNGTLYFVVNENQFYPLWQTDGTAAGTKPAVFQNTPDPAYNQNSDFKFIIFNNDLYFSGKCGSISLSFQPCKITTGVLPVTWLGIQAEWLNANKAKVSWQVAQQQNVKNYTVQYSSDGNNFANACMVLPSTATNYSCIIPSGADTINYYRIMQQDNDGKISYSSMVTLKAASKLLISLYPNPAKDKLYFKGPNNFTGVSIISLNGRVVVQPHVNTAPNYISISHLVKGIYFISFTVNNISKTLKFIKE